MEQYRKKPVIIHAARWFSFRDVPEAHILPYTSANGTCVQCGGYLMDHGYIVTLEGGHIVCPGDWIIRGVEGEYYPCKPGIFQKTYEKVEG